MPMRNRDNSGNAEPAIATPPVRVLGCQYRARNQPRARQEQGQTFVREGDLKMDGIFLITTGLSNSSSAKLSSPETTNPYPPDPNAVRLVYRG